MQRSASSPRRDGVREIARRRSSLGSRPGRWLIASSVVDLTILGALAVNGVLMTALPLSMLAGLLVAAVAFALALDNVKVLLFRRLRVA